MLFCNKIKEKLTGDTFLVLLYVQLNRIGSAGSASTSQRTSIECILIEPTDDCSVPGLQRGASIQYTQIFCMFE